MPYGQLDPHSHMAVPLPPPGASVFPPDSRLLSTVLSASLCRVPSAMPHAADKPIHSFAINEELSCVSIADPILNIKKGDIDFCCPGECFLLAEHSCCKQHDF